MKKTLTNILIGTSLVSSLLFNSSCNYEKPKTEQIQEKSQEGTAVSSFEESSFEEKPIIDFGMARVLHKTRVYAFILGLIDSGIKIECKKESFPEESRIKGNHLKNKIPFDEIKSKIDKEK